MQSSANPKIEPHYYYIVCRPISFNKKLDNDGINAIFNEVINKISKEDEVYVLLDKEQAKLDASQFAQREVPTFFNKQYAKTHKLAKPILCLELEHPLNLGEKSESIFYMKGKETVVTSYKIPVKELKKWQDSDLSILLDEEKYIQPQAHQQAEKEDYQKCSII